MLTIRNLFPDRIAMRLDEPEQVDMVLGDGARDRGATCELISTDPATGAGVAYVRLEADPDPVRVRAAWVSDDDIRAMASAAAPVDAAADRCGGCRMTAMTTWRTDDPCPVCGYRPDPARRRHVARPAECRTVRLGRSPGRPTWTRQPAGDR